MKNKDKYNLQTLTATTTYLLNGCGRQIKDSRAILIKSNNKTVAKIKSKDKGLFEVVMRWLESEE